MLLNLGYGLGRGGSIKPVDSGSGEQGGNIDPAYSRFEIDIGNGEYGEWASVYEILLYDRKGNEFMSGLTATGKSVQDMEGLIAGQYTSNSSYGPQDSVARVTDGKPDIMDPDFPLASGDEEWSSSRFSPLIFYIKPLLARTLGRARLCVNRSSNYKYDPVTTIFKGDDVVLLPVTAPATRVNIYQTTGNSNAAWYEWIF